MAIYKEDIVDIELESGTIHRSWLMRAIGLGDAKGNRFGVRLLRNGEPVNVGSATVTGLFMAPNGTNYVINESQVSGSTWIDGNVAGVILPSGCYAVEGQFCLAIKLSQSGVVTTMRIIDGMVSNTGTTGAVVPSSNIPTGDQIIAAYQQAMAVIDNSVRYDVSQELTNAQKRQARLNVNAAGMALLAPVYSATSTYAVGDHVHYDGYYYVCNTAITTAEEWTAAHWTQVTVGGEVSDLKSALNEYVEYSYYDVPLTWEKGYINSSTGEEVENDKTRSDSYISTGYGDIVIQKAGYGINVLYYDLINGSYVFKENNWASVNTKHSIKKGYEYFRIISNDKYDNKPYVTIHCYKYSELYDEVKLKQTGIYTTPLYSQYGKHTEWTQTSSSTVLDLTEVDAYEFVGLSGTYTIPVASIITAANESGLTTVSGKTITGNNYAIVYNIDNGTVSISESNNTIKSTNKRILFSAYYNSFVFGDIVDFEVSKTLEQTQSQISDLSTRIGTAETNITNLTTRIGTAETNITNLTNRETTVEGNITTLTAKVNGHDGDINELSTQLPAVAAQANNNTTAIGQVNSNISTISANLAQANSNISNLTTHKVAKPLDGNGMPTNGTNGQVLRTNGDGTTEWVNVGLPTDEQTATAIENWMNDHPEASTTVQDHSLTYEKFVNGTLGYITPEMYGAVGDGTTDDTAAIRLALNALTSETVLVFGAKTYLISPSSMNQFILTVPSVSSVEIMGSTRTRIKIDDNVGNYRGIIGFNNCNSVYVHDIAFDHNCENNLLESKQAYEREEGRYTLSDYGLSVCRNVRIQNVDVYNCDSTVSFYFPSLVISGTRVIHNNVFINGCRWIDAQNINVEGFSNYDQSYINAVGNSILITDNVFIGKQWSNSPRTAMEVHPHDSVIISNNIIEKFTVGLHICGGVLNQTTKLAMVSGNTFNVSGDAINLWNYNRSYPSGLLIGMENVFITNNIINMQPDNYGYSTAAAFPAIRFYNHSKSGTVDNETVLIEQTLAYKNVVIEGNIINYPRDTSTEYVDVKSGQKPWAAIHCRYNNDVKDKHIYNLSIKDNEICDCPYGAVLFEAAILNGAIISGNRIINCCSHYFQNPTPGTTGSIPYIDYMIAINSTIETDFDISKNIIKDYVNNSKVRSYIFVHDLSSTRSKYFKAYDNIFDIGETANKTQWNNYVGASTDYELIKFRGTLPSAIAPRLPVFDSLFGCEVTVNNIKYVKTSRLPSSYWNKIEYASTAPASSTGYISGDIVYNIAPTAGGYIGWILVGSSWKGFGLIQS